MKNIGEELLEILENLRLRINTSGVQRTQGLFQAGGRDCPYYQKSLSLFLKDDYLQLKVLIEQVKILIDKCEEGKNG